MCMIIIFRVVVIYYWWRWQNIPRLNRRWQNIPRFNRRWHICHLFAFALCFASLILIFLLLRNHWTTDTEILIKVSPFSGANRIRNLGCYKIGLLLDKRMARVQRVIVIHRFSQIRLLETAAFARGIHLMLYVVLVHVVVTIAVVRLVQIILVVHLVGSLVSDCVKVNLAIILVIISSLAIATPIHTILWILIVYLRLMMSGSYHLIHLIIVHVFLHFMVTSVIITARSTLQLMLLFSMLIYLR